MRNLNTAGVVLAILLFNLLVTFCATRVAPGGGPIDKTPPVILLTVPEANSVHVPENTAEIKFVFSERMDEGSSYNNIFVSPPLKYDVKWKGGDELHLNLQDTLTEGQTYVVSLGTGFKDARNNSLTNSFQLAFSTGAEIDQGNISGKVYGIPRNSIISVFAYRINPGTPFIPDSLQPSYVSQAGRRGTYRLSYLKNGHYRVVAVEDINNNLLPETRFEKFGIPPADVQLDSQQVNYTGLNMQLSQADTISPRLLSCRPMFRDYVQVRFNKAIITAAGLPFFIMDSLRRDTLSVLGYSRNPEFENVLDTYTQPMDSAGIYIVESGQLEDSLGNRSRQNFKVSFQANPRTDTTRFKIKKITPKDSAQSVHPLTPVHIEFSRPVKPEALKSAFFLSSMAGDTIDGAWKKLSVTRMNFYPAEYLQPDSSYLARFDLSRIEDLWGKVLADSQITRYFTILSSREMGEISGRVEVDSTNTKPVYIKVRPVRMGSPVIKDRIESPWTFLAEHLPEGEYKIEGFLDMDGDGRYSFGSLKPFQFAEPFVFPEDTIRVRKRWETQGIILHLQTPGIDQDETRN